MANVITWVCVCLCMIIIFQGRFRTMHGSDRTESRIWEKFSTLNWNVASLLASSSSSLMMSLSFSTSVSAGWVVVSGSDWSMSSWSIILSTELVEEENWLILSGSLTLGLLLITPIVLLWPALLGSHTLHISTVNNTFSGSEIIDDP